MYNLEDKIAVNSRVPTAWLSDGVEIAPLWFPGPFFIIFFLWQEVSPVPKFVFSDSDLQPSLHYNPGSRSPGPGRHTALANSASEPGSFTGKHFLILASEECLPFCQLSRT